MSKEMREQMRADLESLAWQCQETESEGRWTTTLVRQEVAIVSSGTDRQIVWNTAYRDALKHSGQLPHITCGSPHAVKHNPA